MSKVRNFFKKKYMPGPKTTNFFGCLEIQTSKGGFDENGQLCVNQRF